MAPGSPKTQRSLMEMPNEVLLEICEILYSHCSDIRFTFKKDLLSLSMANKRLRAIAQPFLLREARPRNIRGFLQIITEKPYLAAQVRRFCNSGDISLQEEVYEMTDDTNASHYRLLERTLAKLTNAKRLSIDLPFSNGYELEGSQKVSVSVSVPMKSVTRLSLRPWAHFDLGQIGDFLAMMPRLERLKVIHCTQIERQLPLASLRSLTLDYSLLGPYGFQNIVGSCPKLEHLDLRFNRPIGGETIIYDPGVLTWAQAQGVLQSRRQTLKHLKLELSLDIHFARVADEEKYFGSFCGFNGLESLWVPKASFGLDVRADMPTFPQSVQHLVSMLPESLTCICFGGSYKKGKTIKVLAQAIEAGYFPSLKRVMVQESDDPGGAPSGYCKWLSARLGVCFEILDWMEMKTEWKQYTTAAYP
ncbi:hypothetical protein GGI42DRAFT_343554 [Trichoderma sp. SZMC 28013]